MVAILQKVTIATLLVVISMANAQPARLGPPTSTAARQTVQSNAPYNPSGWRPQGMQFGENSSAQRHFPQQEYGPPKNVEERFDDAQSNIKAKPARLQQEKRTEDVEEIKQTIEPEQPYQSGAYYLVLPQAQIYAAPLVAVAPAKIQAVPVSGSFTTLYL